MILAGLLALNLIVGKFHPERKNLNIIETLAHKAKSDDHQSHLETNFCRPTSYVSICLALSMADKKTKKEQKFILFLCHMLLNETKIKRKRGAHIYFFPTGVPPLYEFCSGETDTLQSTFADKEEALLFNLLGFGGRQPAAGAGTWPVAGRDKGESECNTAGAPLMYQPGLSYITLI